MKQVHALSLALLMMISCLAGCIGDEETKKESNGDDDEDQNNGGNQTNETNTNETNTSTMVCYNRLIHYVTNDSSQDSCEAYMYLENHTSPHSEENFTGCYNSVTHNQHEGMPQDECESFTWVDMSGRPGGGDHSANNSSNETDEITQEDCERRGGNWTEEADSPGEFYCDFGEDNGGGDSNNTETRTWSVVDLNNTMLQEGAISSSECGIIYTYPAWSPVGPMMDVELRNDVSNLTGTVIDVWIAVYEEHDSTVVIPDIKTVIGNNVFEQYILVENGNMIGIVDLTLPNQTGCGSNMNAALNEFMDNLWPEYENDSDGDGLVDGLDNCPNTLGNSTLGLKGCLDSDGDGWPNSLDNCPDIQNVEQFDNDMDDIGDVCDSDMDGDGVANDVDAFPHDPNESEDTDGDGVGDNADQCPNTSPGTNVDDHGCFQAQDHFIDISGMAFSPNSLTISVGDMVTWTNQDGSSHTATADNGEFNSGTLGNGQTFSFTFTTAGTYTYKCNFHGSMTATIIVE